MLVVNNECKACGSLNLKKTLDLGLQPLANSYAKSSCEKHDIFPLAVNLCLQCYHLQLTHTVDPKQIYKNYLYVTGTNKTIQDYSRWFTQFVIEYTNINRGDILDIGCNDGTQLDYFSSFGFNTHGIDPAENLKGMISDRHYVQYEFFNSNTVIGKRFDLIIAQNVFAHNPNPKSFLDKCQDLMNDHSYLFIQTSQANMIFNNEFDTIYHEHINYFNVNSMLSLTKRTGLNLIDVVKVPIHGISYIFILSKLKAKQSFIENAKNLEHHLYDIPTYSIWEEAVKANMNCLIKSVQELQQKGYLIVGYGAAAKANVVLNYCNLDVEFIIDDNILKQNLYTPGTNIPIVSSNKLSEYKNHKIVFISLAWNFIDEIRAKLHLLRTNNDDLILTYFPQVQVKFLYETRVRGS